MLLSRFWYVLLGLALGAAVFALFVAQSMYNRAGGKVMAEGLSSDAQVVSWYMRNVSRERSGQLIKFALNSKVASGLAEASKKEQIPKKTRENVTAALKKLVADVPAEFGFDAVFAVDQRGRVVGQYGFLQTEGTAFELGGYPLVADALHGYVRDGSFVWDKLHLAVARPVEAGAGALPVGAVVGLKTIDERFAQDVSGRTGAAIAFYKNGERVAAAVPDGFLKAELDGIIRDIKTIGEDKDYQEKGRSSVRRLTDHVGAVYSRLPGEAWSLGAGYVVGRKFTPLKSPSDFFFVADDRDKASANLLLIGLAAFLAMSLGLLFSFMEHTRPLKRFAALANNFAAGKEDQLQASQLGGIFRKLATQINDGVDHAVAKGGGSRRAADLQSVLGDIPEQPAMSAFSFPEASADAAPSTASLPEPPAPAAPAPEVEAPKRTLPEPPKRPGAPARQPDFAATMPEGQGAGEMLEELEPLPEEPNTEWKEIFQQFVKVKQECGENTASLTYEKFEGTLRKNEAAIQNKHNVTRVKFTVYVKEGRAALKASPQRD